MNSTLPKDIINDAYNEDHAAACAEWGAHFRKDIEDFIAIETVESCVAQGIEERQPISGQRGVAFVDPSGGSKDAMTLAVAHMERDQIIIDCIRARKPPFSPEAVVYDFSEDLKRYGITRVVGDRYAGEWPREQFRKNGITYEPSAQPKSTLYNNLLPTLNSKKVSLLDNKTLINQLTSLERRTSRGGRDQIDHPPKGHDDVANAVAGVCSMLSTRQLHQSGRFVLRL